MEVATREVKTKITMDCNDGYVKNIFINEFYMGESKTPVQRIKTVKFINPNGKIDDSRAYSSKLLIDESEEFSTEYKNLKIEISILIHYNDSKCIKILYIYKDWHLPDAIVERDITPDGKIDKDRVKEYWIFPKDGVPIDEQLFVYRNVIHVRESCARIM